MTCSTPGRHLGLVPGRLRADRRRPTARAATRSAARRTTTSAASRSSTTARTTTRSSTTSRRRTRTTCRRRRSPAIGQTDQANHEYDLTDFDAAVAANNLPAVSFLKAAGVPGRPRRLLRPAGRADVPRQHDQRAAEVEGLVVAPRSSSPTTTPTAGTTTSAPPIRTARPTRRSTTAALCGNAPVAGGYQDRCGSGPRLPLLVISPVRKDELRRPHARPSRPRSSKFIEDNWYTGRIGDSSFDKSSNSIAGMLDFKHKPDTTPLILDPATGAVKSH